MRTLAQFARIILALCMIVIGANTFLHLIPIPQMTGPMKSFSEALFVSHYVQVVGSLQVLTGALLFVNRYIPFALTVMGPIIVNVDLTHILMSHEPGALVAPSLVTIFWFLVFWRVRSSFSGIFDPRKIV